MNKLINLSLIFIIIFFTIFSGCIPNKTINKNEEYRTKRLNEGIIIWGITEKPRELDPGLCGDMDGTDIINNLYEGLFRIIEEKVDFGVAESYELLNDNKTYIFKLRDDALWSDGKKVRAQDFEYSFKRLLKNDFYAPKKDLLLPIKNARKIINENKDIDILGVDSINEKTLKIVLEEPIDYLLNLLSLITFMPVREDIVNEHGWSKDPNKIVSNGPYCLSEYKDGCLKLKKNKFYKNKTKNNSNINEIIIKSIEDENTAYIKYKNGKLDIIDRIPLSEEHKLLHGEELITAPYNGLYFYSFNFNIECLKDKRVRQAINKAIDRQTIVKQIRHTQELAANSYLRPELIKELTYKTFRYNIKEYYDISEARRLFLEAGYNKDNQFPEIEIYYNSENDNKIIAEAVQEMLRKNLNINVILSGQEWSIFNEQRRNLKYKGLVKNSRMYEYFTPESFLEIFLPNNRSYSGFYNQQFNLVFNNFLKTSSNSKKNREKKERLMLEILNILEEEMPIIPLFFYTSHSLVKSDIKNYYINNIGYKYLGSIKIER